jgi:ribosomal protein S27E
MFASPGMRRPTMDAEKYSRSIAMMCPTCGHEDFEFEQDEGPIRCTSCSRVFTREELIRENGEVIEAEVDELKADVLKDARKELSEGFRKAFQGSKHIKFR